MLEEFQIVMSLCFERCFVDWLEWLGYGAESHWMLVSLRLKSAIRQLENSVTLARVPFSNQGRIKQQKEKDGLHLSLAVPKVQWDSNPHCPYGY